MESALRTQSQAILCLHPNQDQKVSIFVARKLHSCGRGHSNAWCTWIFQAFYICRMKKTFHPTSLQLPSNSKGGAVWHCQHLLPEGDTIVTGMEKSQESRHCLVETTFKIDGFFRSTKVRICHICHPHGEM